MTQPLPWNRRDFVRWTAGLAVTAAWPKAEATAADTAEALPTADQFILGKDQRLVVHNAKVGELETPLALLRQHRLTPKELLFVRNNQVLPQSLTLEPATDGEWRIELGGSLEAPRSITLAELKRLPQQQEVELVLQCSGNSRSRFAKSVKTDGVPWQHGAMGNVKLKGVSLTQLVQHLGIKLKPELKFVTAEGKDAPALAGAADFEHSLPLADALDRTILAWELNGEPLPKVHGGPVRLITPGFYATMNVKWLSTLRFEEQESANQHHAGRYRNPLKPIVPGSKFSLTRENSEPNWNMRLRSVLFAPLAGEQLTAGKFEVSGVAWNDGLTKIEVVEVSTDGGKSWQQAELTAVASPFAWQPWKVTCELLPGERTILCRACDVLGRSQPLNGSIAWNPAGYAWNGVDSVTIQVS